MNRPKIQIQDPVGESSITIEAAMAAARHVYRDPQTGRFLVSKTRLSRREVREEFARRARRAAARAKTLASKKR